MEKGFTIELYNNTNTEKEVQLFTQDGLPEGVSAKVFRTEIDYHNLLNIAKIEGFMGSGLQVDTDLFFSYFTSFNPFLMKTWPGTWPGLF